MTRIKEIASLLLMLTLLSALTACDKNDCAVSSGQPSPDEKGDDNNLRIVAIKQPFTDENGTRASTDFGGTYATTFTNGDEIGIIAVKDGAVLDEYNNVKLTYNGTTGKWVGDPVYFNDGATYIAYSPYRSVMNDKKSAQEIYDAFDVSADQSTAALFSANDLMIDAIGTINKTAKTLNFSFEHKLAMLETSTLHGRTTNDWVYPIKNTIPSMCSINGAKSGEFFKNPAEGTDAPYRCLVKPVANVSLTLNYTLDSASGWMTIQWTASNQSFVAGQRRKIISSRTRDIRVGDYYYSDGSIFPSETGALPPDGCIGVVFSVTPSQRDISNGIHIYVAALSCSQPATWYGWDMPRLDELKTMNATRSICEPNMKLAGGSGYRPSEPTTAIKPEEGVWIWSNEAEKFGGDGGAITAYGIWFKGSKGTEGEVRGLYLSSYITDNGKHSYVRHSVWKY